MWGHVRNLARTRGGRISDYWMRGSEKLKTEWRRYIRVVIGKRTDAIALANENSRFVTTVVTSVQGKLNDIMNFVSLLYPTLTLFLAY